MKVKALVVFCLFLAALTIPIVPAQAGDGYEKYIEWYSDATKTEVVGWRQEYCNGTREAEGFQTSYRESWFGEMCEENWSSGYWVCQLSGSSYTSCPAQCSICVP
jgi:hypothetical protein